MRATCSPSSPRGGGKNPPPLGVALARAYLGKDDEWPRPRWEVTITTEEEYPDPGRPPKPPLHAKTFLVDYSWLHAFKNDEQKKLIKSRKLGEYRGDARLREALKGKI